MSKPIVLQDDFSKGSYQDLPRHQLPKGKAWMVTDMLPNLADANYTSTRPLTRRHGWVRSQSVMSATSSSYAAGVGFAPFSAQSKILGFDEDGRLYTWTPGGGAATNVGAALVPAHPPTYYRDMSIIFDVNGSTAPKKYDGSTLGNLGGSPPAASVSTVFKDHLVCANSAANRNRVWFSSAGAPETWDTAASGQWLDASRNVLGLATVRNMILVFEEGQTERIRGDIIPGVVGSDIVVEPLLSIGCADPASIAVTVDYCIFANNQGIYLCDGIGAVNLAEQCGMLSYWRWKIPNYNAGWNIAGALFKDWYVFSVMDSTSLVIAGAIHVPTRTWVSLTNVAASQMVATPQGSYNIAGDYLWMSERLAPYVSDLSAIFSSVYGSATVDGNGTALTWSLETPYYKGKPGLKRWKNVYLTYDAASTPAITVARIPDPTSSTYTQIGSTLVATGYQRKRVLGGKAVDGMGLKISGNAAQTSIYAIEADGWPLEPGRV